MKVLFLASLLLLLTVVLARPQRGIACNTSGCFTTKESDQDPVRGGGSRENDSMFIILVISLIVQCVI